MKLEEKVKRLVDVMDNLNETIPHETRTILTEIGRLDGLAKKQSEKVQKLKITFVANLDKLNYQQRSKACELLEKETRVILELSEKKMALAKDMQENVRQAQKAFEIAAKRFETSKSGKKSSDSEDVPPSKRRRMASSRRATEDEDDEEKCYCWCKLEKDDEMVFCENPDCPHQWYHFTCIGMTKAPDGDFYCTSACKEAVAKKKGRGGSGGPAKIRPKRTN